MVVDFHRLDVITEILYLLYSDNYTNYTVNRHSGTNPKVLDILIIRHYRIRPCGKTLLNAILKQVEFQIKMVQIQKY